MTKISIKLREATVAPVVGSARLRRAVEAAGSRLIPQFPGIESGDLASYFSVEIDDQGAPALVTTLLELPEVEAAYVKPPDELPAI